MRVWQEVQALPRALHLILRSLLAAFVALVCAGLAVAEPVVLRAKIGTFEASGELVQFDGRYYDLETPQGRLTLRAEAVTCVAGSGCPTAGETTGFTISSVPGTSRVLLPALIRAFAQTQGLSVSVEGDENRQEFLLSRQQGNPRAYRITLMSRPASESMADMIAQIADVAVIDRSISQSEALMANDVSGIVRTRIVERLLALDALALVVSPANTLQKVEISRLAQGLQTPGSTWESFGGSDPVEVKLTLQARSEDLSRLAETVGAIGVPVEYMADSTAVLRATRRDPARLGVTTASQTGGLRALALQGACGITHAPSPAQIAMGRYPLSTAIKVYAWTGRVTPEQTEFLEFLRTDAAARIIRRAGFVRPEAVPARGNLEQRALSAIRMSAADLLLPLQVLLKDLSGAQPLALSLLADPQTREQQALQRYATDALITALLSGRLDPARVILLSNGSASMDTVTNALRNALGENAAIVDAFGLLTQGKLLPATCPEATWLNISGDPVEVWYRPAP